MTFVLDAKECRLIADGLATLAAIDRANLPQRRWRLLNQLGVMFEAHATPPPISTTEWQRRDTVRHLSVVKKP